MAAFAWLPPAGPSVPRLVRARPRHDGGVDPSSRPFRSAAGLRDALGLAQGNVPRRLTQLYAGLVLFGASVALQLRAGLGLNSWDVFHQGVAEHTGLSIGTVVVLASAAVLLLWVPLRVRPGLGTVSNVLLVGLSMDATLALTPTPQPLLVRVPLFLVAVVLNGAATGLYIAARFGPGPRDGLMTGLCRVTGRSTRLVRTVLEVTVLVTGFVLGGAVGIGTVVHALTIGPLIQFFQRLFAPREPAGAAGRGLPGQAAP